LNYVELTVISNADCAIYYGNKINSAKICTSTVGGIGTCRVRKLS
jgi:hypothetical protein